MSFIREHISFRKFMFDITVSCALCLGFGNDTPLGLLTTSLGTLIGLSEIRWNKNDLKELHMLEMLFFEKIQTIHIHTHFEVCTWFFLKGCFQLTRFDKTNLETFLKLIFNHHESNKSK